MSHLPPSVYDALEHPKNCAPDDFWGQVRRTVNGKPVSQDQIDMIIASVREVLCFNSKDVLLDLCCGNGAVCLPFFDEIAYYLGIDMSPSLIAIAIENFQRTPSHLFLCQTAEAYVTSEINPQRFTKALCYAAFYYLAAHEAKQVLSNLATRFNNIKTLYIGNIPDKSRASSFFQDRPQVDLTDHTTSIGKWYTQSEFAELAVECGWSPIFTVMPNTFYQSHYRFNAILTRKE